MSEELTEAEFSIPKKILDDIFEMSGDVDKNKGLILVVVSESGVPMIYSRFDSLITELALKRYGADWCMLPDFDMTKKELGD